MMVFCDLETTAARATIQIGGFGSVHEPDIINITVSRTRGQLVGTAQGSFHAKDNQSGSGGSGIKIFFGNDQVFAGTVKRIDTSPSFRCAGEIIVKFSAEDFLHKIQGKTITRRQKHPALGQLAFIVGHYKRVSLGFDSPTDVHNVERGASPVEFLSPTTNMAEWLNFLKGGETNTVGQLHPVTRIADPLISSSAAGGGGAMELHDHSSLDTSGPHAGGPAVAVFGVK